MSAPVVILSAGGIRSLVATALGCSGVETSRVTLVHFRDNRGNAQARLEHVKKQAQHRGIKQVIELTLPQVVPGRGQTAEGSVSLVRPRVLVEGLALALTLKADRLIWPAHSGGDFHLSAKIAEQTVLLQHLAQLENAQAPMIETPLLELTDQQLIEVGAQVEAPWQLAWTCLQNIPQPCKACEACRRRRKAFDAAGLVDPVEQLLERKA